MKAEKKEAKNMVTMAEQCLTEKLDTAIDVISEYEEIDATNKVELPEFIEVQVVKTEVVMTDAF